MGEPTARGGFGDEMERFYRVFPWEEDRDFFKRRVEEGRRLFEDLLGHEWLSPLQGMGEVRILDVMGGTGIGGASLALALLGRGVEARVTVLDVRASALELARRYSRELLELDVTTVRARVEEFAGVVDCPFDAIVMYGHSSPHLDPYQFVQAAANMAACLSGGGVVILEEGDRVYEVCYARGYRHVLPEEAGEERLVVSYHA
ncbi:MAG: class I SAM-dependent methyltransferase, partial [Desulfurococcales archaeon]|nr:class I SAM-dependent methyltransferase [Desulfurococcales archaeon]